ncbi:fructose bisphosphate aldolase [Georgenia muralis]
MNEQQLEKMRTGTGFVAALDQSGGSTPKALRLYGIEDDASASEEEMFDLVHQMRARIMTSPAFTGEHILGTILFENTMDREVEGRPTAEYLWDIKTIVPILKVDKGLDAETDGARTMKPMPGLDELLARAVEKGVFATKMRSVVCGPGAGLDAVLDQQFQVAHRIIKAGLVPIIEPEIEIRCPEKEAAEDQLHAGLLAHAERLGPDELIMLKLTPPERDDLYADLVAHPQVLRVLFLSGGYSRDEACERLGRNHGCVASFSRALTEGLRAEMSPAEFDAALAASIAQIAAASAT